MPFENSHHPLQQYARILGIKDFKVAKENENRQNTSLSKAPNNSTPRQLPPIVPSANLNRYLVKNPPPASVYTTSIPSTSKPVENQEVYLDLSDENNIECDSDSNDSFNNWHRSQTNQSHNRKSFENSVHVSSLLSRIQEDENDDNDDIFNRNTQRLAKKRASVGERVSLKAQTTFCRDSGTLSSRRINPMDELLELQIEKDEEPVNFSDQNKILNPFKNLPSAKRIKVEKEEEDDDIQIIEMVPPPKQNVEIVEKETDNEQEEYGPEERAALASFSKLRLSNLNGSLKKMKYSIGSKRFQILAIIEDINEPLRVVDNLWTMKVEVSDDSESKKLAFIDNQILEKLIGYTCAEAIAIRKSSDLEKRKDGKRRLEALEHQLLRLDLIFEIEFFPEATLSCPVIRSMETLSEYLDVY
uniref:RMI1_C domain-containing protein n=1 Tax=Caenorhabditis japonica TaxID=281687 RepID=A0A8R1DY95_CAEJA